MIQNLQQSAQSLIATINAAAGQLDQIGVDDLQAALARLNASAIACQARLASAAGITRMCLQSLQASADGIVASLACELASGVQNATTSATDAANGMSDSLTPPQTAQVEAEHRASQNGTPAAVETNGHPTKKAPFDLGRGSLGELLGEDPASWHISTTIETADGDKIEIAATTPTDDTNGKLAPKRRSRKPRQ